MTDASGQYEWPGKRISITVRVHVHVHALVFIFAGALQLAPAKVNALDLLRPLQGTLALSRSGLSIRARGSAAPGSSVPQAAPAPSGPGGRGGLYASTNPAVPDEALEVELAIPGGWADGGLVATSMCRARVLL